MTLPQSTPTTTRALTLIGLALGFAVALPAQANNATKRPAAPVVADSFALQPVSRGSWTSDRQRYGIGDIVTIVIDERTLASANLTDNNAESRKKSLGLDIAPPSSPGAPSAEMRATFDFNQSGDSRTKGDAVRGNSFRSALSARVIAVSPTGMLQVRGKKMVNVDQNQQEVTVTGWVRPQDIAVGSNTVESSRVADAEVVYGQKGALGKPRSGMLSRVLGALWP
ncbi:MAG: flagellar basal body L-ring protein FlgH [Gemmatimonadetes bacterium]|nr:flagellar basal body L-ring protein FlgH [Gemmatimonadota bacterium]